MRLGFLFLSFSFFWLLMFIVRRERCVLCGFVMQEEHAVFLHRLVYVLRLSGVVSPVEIQTSEKNDA